MIPPPFSSKILNLLDPIIRILDLLDPIIPLYFSGTFYFQYQQCGVAELEFTYLQDPNKY